ncbi:MAG: amidase family protein, partial [Pseudomonadota bacterium]
LARSAEDLQLAMRLCAGANPLDAAGWRLELPPPRQRSLKDLRVAVLADSPIAPVDAEVRARVEQVAEMLEAVGAQVSRDALPELDLREAHDNYLGLLTAVTGGDRVKTEYRNWMIMNSKRQRIRMAWQAFFERWDILLCPIMPTTALHHDHSIDWEARTIQVNGKAQAYGDQVFWAGLATGAYLPSTVFPTGAARDGLPIGLQAIGGEYNDYTTIEFTRLVAAELGGFASPPAYAAPAVS